MIITIGVSSSVLEKIEYFTKPIIITSYKTSDCINYFQSMIIYIIYDLILKHQQKTNWTPVWLIRKWVEYDKKTLTIQDACLHLNFKNNNDNNNTFSS